MDVQINNTDQNNSFFSKYFKNIVLFFLIIVTIIFLCILFIKYGSNNFLWETQKDKNEPGGQTRVKRGIEDRIKELKESERLTINLALLEKMDNMEVLESRLAQAETELATLKEKYKNNNITNEHPSMSFDKNQTMSFDKNQVENRNDINIKQENQINKNIILDDKMKQKNILQHDNIVSLEANKVIVEQSKPMVLDDNLEKNNAFKGIGTITNIYDNFSNLDNSNMNKPNPKLQTKNINSDNEDNIVASTSSSASILNKPNKDRVSNNHNIVIKSDVIKDVGKDDNIINKKQIDTDDIDSSFEIEDVTD